MDNYELISCDFQMFVNLEELNLSGNLLTDITTTNLDKIPKLRVLDITNNKIDNSLKEVNQEISWNFLRNCRLLLS